MPRPARIHNLRENKGERSPRRLWVYDCETDWSAQDGIELHQLRLWEGLLVLREPGAGTAPLCQPRSGSTGAELAEAISADCRAGGVTWAYAHNQSFDLAASALPLRLLELGWQLGQHNLASDAPWARLRRRSRRLRLVDSFSWLPVSIARLGQLLELPRPPLPEGEGSEAEWRARCRADVAILAAALCRLMDEWDRLGLGVWSLTGSASGWNAMLHMTPREGRWHYARADREAPRDRLGAPVAPVVIDPDPQARSLEREAIYSGRRDLWRWGRLPPEHYVELDFAHAHLSICEHLPLPVRRWARFEGLELDDWRLHNPYALVLARCLVRTCTPRYPLRWRGAVLHPVGEFETLLAPPEISEALERGELLRIGEGYGYRGGHFMRSWAAWCRALLEAPAGEVDPLLQAAAKGWSRKVPGRWAMLVGRELERRPSAHLGWHLEPAAFGWPAAKGHVLWIGGERIEVARDQESEDSFPAVLATIQSWARLLLGRMLERLGPGAVVQVNTDSALVRASRLEELARERWERLGSSSEALGELEAAAAEISETTWPLRARIKAEGRGGRVLSPQHLEHAGRRRYSGVPGDAVEVAPDRFEFLTWPKLGGQLEYGDSRGYVRVLRRVDLSALLVARWTYQDGCCEPIEAAWAPETGTRLLPPSRAVCGLHGAPLWWRQHPLLPTPA